MPVLLPAVREKSISERICRQALERLFQLKLAARLQFGPRAPHGRRRVRCPGSRRRNQGRRHSGPEAGRPRYSSTLRRTSSTRFRRPDPGKPVSSMRRRQPAPPTQALNRPLDGAMSRATRPNDRGWPTAVRVTASGVRAGAGGDGVGGWSGGLFGRPCRSVPDRTIRDRSGHRPSAWCRGARDGRGWR